MIESIGSIGSLGNLSLGNQLTIQKSSENNGEFSNILNDLINNVNVTQQAKDNDILNIARGTADDLHTITINAQKSELALLTAVQVRNKILDSYNELMRVTL